MLAFGTPMQIFQRESMMNREWIRALDSWCAA